MTTNADRIVCINLSSRPDRWEWFSGRAATSAILAGRVERFTARTPADTFRPPFFGDDSAGQGHRRRDGAYACRQSHLDVWHKAIVDNVQHLLVFEDDAVLAPGFDAAVGRLYAELPEDWYGYFLGGHVNPYVQPFAPGCVRLHGTYGSHAYGLSAAGVRRAYEHLLYWPKEPVDLALHTLCNVAERSRFYAVPSWITWQEDGYSDIDGQHNWTAGRTGASA